MSVGLVPTGAATGVVAGIVWRTLRDRLRSALAWGTLFAAVVYSSAWGYHTAYATRAARLGLQRGLGQNLGVAALFGTPADLTTLAGFTSWRSNGVLMIVGLVWGVLLGARALRGEEEDGRWEILLAGVAGPRRATAAVLGGLVAVVLVVWAFTAVGGWLASLFVEGTFGSAGAALLATTLVGPVLLGASLAACCGHLVSSRRRAAGIAAGILATAFVVRMLVAVYPRWHWVRRIDPLCWYDETAPLVHDRIGWLAAAFALTVTLTAVTVALAGVRDLDAALLARPRMRTRRRPVGGAFALSARVSAVTTLGWFAAVVALGSVVGVLSGPIAGAADSSPGLRRVFERLGGGAHAQAAAFLGVTIVILATVVSLGAAALTGALCDEESSGRLDAELSRPLSRTRWLAGRTAAAALALCVLGLALASALVVGTRVGNAKLPMTDVLAAGLNVVPIGAVALAFGLAAFGLRPRLGAVAVHALVAASFVIEMVGSLVRAPDWVLDLSLLHHLTRAPAVPVRLGTDVVLLALAVGLAAVGFVAFAARDVTDV